MLPSLIKESSYWMDPRMLVLVSLRLQVDELEEKSNFVAVDSVFQELYLADGDKKLAAADEGKSEPVPDG